MSSSPSFDPSRRQALWLIAAGLMLGRSSRAAEPDLTQSLPKSAEQPEQPSTLKPYDMIEPPVTGDARIVRLFFTYDCPHCRSYHNGLTQWGGTLPAPLQFHSTPLITSPENDNQTLAVYGRLIAQALDPKAVPRYDFAIYALLQGDELRQTPPVGELLTTHVLAALVEAGIDSERITAYLESEEMEKLEEHVPQHAKAVMTYRIKATPSVAISGRFLVNPDHASGNAPQFLALLNGIVSRSIEGGRHAL